MPAWNDVRRDPEPFLRDAPLERRGEEAVVAAGQDARRDVGPPFEWPRLTERRARTAADRAGAPPPAPLPGRRGSRAPGRPRDRADPAPASRPVRASPRPGRCSTTTRRTSRPASGSSRSGGRSGRRGPARRRVVRVKPPNDCATSTTSVRPPIDAAVQSAYSASPDPSSPAGRSIGTATWPRASSSGPSRCHSHARPPAPGMSTNVAMT